MLKGKSMWPFMSYSVVLFALLLGVAVGQFDTTDKSETIEHKTFTSSTTDASSTSEAVKATPKPKKTELTTPGTPNITLSPLAEEIVDSYKKSMEILLKQMSDQMLNVVLEADLTQSCIFSLIQMMSGVRRLDDWAVAMLDSTVRVPVGVIDGTSLHMGEFDQCLSAQKFKLSKDNVTEVEDFRGQYCTVEIIAPKGFREIPAEHRTELHADSIIPELLKSGSMFKRLMAFHYGFKFASIRAGLCMPSTCTEDDIWQLVDGTYKDLHMTAKVIACETKQDFQIYKPEQLIILVVIAVLICLTVVSAIWSCVLSSRVSKGKSLGGIKPADSTLKKCLEACSFNQNLNRLFSTESTCLNHLAFLHGTRVGIVFSIIAAYTFALPYITFLHKLARKANHVSMRNTLLVGLLGNASIPIDTLIFMSGLLAIYRYGTRVPKAGNSGKSFMFLLLTVVRSMGGVLVAIGFFMLLPLIGNGPDWKDLVDRNVDICRESWWRNIIFISNFWSVLDNCMYHTHLISILVQCSLLAVCVLWVTFKTPKLGIFIQVAFIFVSAVAAGLLNVFERFPPALHLKLMNGDTMFEMMSLDLIKPYNHVAVYFMGMLFGYLLLQEFSWTKVRKYSALLLWAVSAVFVLYIPIQFPYWGETYRILSALYAGSFRTVWGLHLGCFVLLCFKNEMGCLGKFLSWKFWIPFDRVSYLAYMVHPVLLFYYHGQARQTFFLGLPEVLIHAVSFCLFSFSFAMFIYVFMTAPLSGLTKIFCAPQLSEGNLSNQRNCPKTDDLTSIAMVAQPIKL